MEIVIPSSVVVRIKRNNGPEVHGAVPDPHKHPGDVNLHGSIMMWGVGDTTECQEDVLHTIEGRQVINRVITVEIHTAGETVTML